MTCELCLDRCKCVLGSRVSNIVNCGYCCTESAFLRHVGPICEDCRDDVISRSIKESRNVAHALGVVGAYLGGREHEWWRQNVRRGTQALAFPHPRQAPISDEPCSQCSGTGIDRSARCQECGGLGRRG